MADTKKNIPGIPSDAPVAGGEKPRLAPSSNECKKAGSKCTPPSLGTHKPEAKAPKPKPKMLGTSLLESGLIDRETLEKALEIQKKTRKKLGETLIGMGVADEVIIARHIAKQLGIYFARLDNAAISAKVYGKIPAALARMHQVIPVKIMEDGRLAVAMADPKNLTALDDVRFAAGMPVMVVCSPKGEVERAVLRIYGPGRKQDSSKGSEPRIEVLSVTPKDITPKEINDLYQKAQISPIVKLVNSILSDAITKNASDIHIEPGAAEVKVRFRVDGVLTDIAKFESHVHAPLASRLKIISNMDISVRRKPQDGKTRVRMDGNTYYLRVSTIPTAHGEKVVIRILAQDRSRVLLEEMNFPMRVYSGITSAIKKSAGIVLVTGPTGSGKSTTLYTFLQRIKSPAINIVTVEDPIEYEMEGVNQVQVNPKAGLTFASALRSILRQDPDVIMLGEIRDSETAGIAVEAAQTGHLVFSTLHTNNAPAAVARLADLGVEPYLIASALEAVMAQRLVRKVCPYCARPDNDAKLLLAKFPVRMTQNLGHASFIKGKGCRHCGGTGFMGRMGIYEIITGSPVVREVIGRTANTQDVIQAALGDGYSPMAEDGLHKAAVGLTTLGEVLRVALVDSPSIALQEGACAASLAYRAGASEYDVSLSTGKTLKTVLVVDDNSTMRKWLSHMLTKAGYRIITAQSGMEALQMIFEEKPDLIVTDYLMPDMDGMMLIRKIKTQMNFRNMPIMVLTAQDEASFGAKVMREGADDYVKKPIRPEVLIQHVSRLVGPSSIIDQALPGHERQAFDA